MSIPEVSKTTVFQWPCSILPDDLAPEVPHYLTFGDLCNLHVALARRAAEVFQKFLPASQTIETRLHFSKYVIGLVMARKLCVRSVIYEGCLTLKEYQCIKLGIFPKKYTLQGGTRVKESHASSLQAYAQHKLLKSSVQKVHLLYKSIAYLDIRPGCLKQAIFEANKGVIISSVKGKGPFILSWATIKCICKFDMKRLALTGYPENKRQDYAFTGESLAEIKDIAKKSYETNKSAKILNMVGIRTLMDVAALFD